MNMGERWVIVSGISVGHEMKFAGLRDNREDAIKYANELASNLYPNTVIEHRDYQGSESYYHPNSAGGDNLFIRVFEYTSEFDNSMLHMYSDLAELRATYPPPTVSR